LERKIGKKSLVGVPESWPQAMTHFQKTTEKWCKKNMIEGGFEKQPKNGAKRA
jgi:hypothetical protein